MAPDRVFVFFPARGWLQEAPDRGFLLAWRGRCSEHRRAKGSEVVWRSPLAESCGTGRGLHIWRALLLAGPSSRGPCFSLASVSAFSWCWGGAVGPRRVSAVALALGVHVFPHGGVCVLPWLAWSRGPCWCRGVFVLTEGCAFLWLLGGVFSWEAAVRARARLDSRPRVGGHRSGLAARWGPRPRGGPRARPRADARAAPPAWLPWRSSRAPQGPRAAGAGAGGRPCPRPWSPPAPTRRRSWRSRPSGTSTCVRPPLTAPPRWDHLFLLSKEGSPLARALLGGVGVACRRAPQGSPRQEGFFLGRGFRGALGGPGFLLFLRLCVFWFWGASSQRCAPTGARAARALPLVRPRRLPGQGALRLSRLR